MINLVDSYEVNDGNGRRYAVSLGIGDPYVIALALAQRARRQNRNKVTALGGQVVVTIKEVE